MIGRRELLMIAVLFLPSVILAQSPHDRCPEGFRYVGTLTGNGSFEEPLNKTLEISLPENAKLDTSYQQTKVATDNARSKFRPQDIPKGIDIVPYGQTDLGKEWAVSDPELKTVPDTDGRTRHVFAMNLSCSMSEHARQFGGCAVNVDVCYKPQK